MIRFCLTFFLAIIMLTAFSQTGQISGKVLDSKTQEPLPFANVFINNTTIGVAADANGEFTLKNLPIGIADVVFSFVGYKSYQTKLTVNADEQLKITIKLIPDEIELENIEVKGTRDKEWDKQLKRFEKIFLGETKNATSCKIVNSWAIDFSEDTNSPQPIFTAKALIPIEIENIALGYKIYFYLKSFQASSQGYIILGNFRFEEMLTKDPKLARRWTENRLEVYQQSDRFLFKAILDKRVKEQGFMLYTDKPGYESSTLRSAVFSQELNKSVVRYNTDNIVSPGKRAGEYRIQLKGRIEVHNLNGIAQKKTYKDIPYPIAWLEVAGNVVDVTSNGVVLNSTNVTTSGYMSNSRVGDLLPFDYAPGEEGDMVKNEIIDFSLDQLKFKRLQERAYLHTDKAYYYGGEAIWFKGYMKYFVPEMRDSLSRVLYVELINSKKKIIYTRILPIDSGRVSGDILLADTISSGDYYLRAYTQWMLNYDPKSIFIKPLPILDLSDGIEKVEPNLVAPSSPNHVFIKSDKQQYGLREEIALDVSVKNERGELVEADLSISIIDSEQVAAVGAEKNILQDYELQEMSDKSGNKVKLRLPVEYGISFSGEFSNKGKPEKANLTIVQGKFDDMLTMETDDAGIFWVNGFQFKDTVQIAFQATTSKGKPYGKVTLHKKEVPPNDFLLPASGVKVITTEKNQRFATEYILPEDVRMLDDVVVVQAQRLVESRQAKTYGKADYTVSGDVLLVSSATNLLAGMQGRIPGLTVVPTVDERGVSTYTVRIRGGSSSMSPFGSKEPLLMIDGIPYTEDIGVALSQLSPANVDRVEVVTHANPMLGVRASNGLIAIYTKSGVGVGGGQQGQPDVKLFQLIGVPGYSVPMKFPFLNYSDKNQDHSKGDFRSTIHWAPWLRATPSSTASVSFYSADLPVKYKVVVEGITSEGVPVRGESLIEIIR